MEATNHRNETMQTKIARPNLQPENRNLKPPITLLTLCTLLTLLPAVTGCQVLTYTGPTGERFMRGSLGAKTAIASLSVDADTNGVRHLELKGYENDTVQALGAVTEAAVKAAVQGVKPVAP